MPSRLTSLLASAAMFAAVTPASAQDIRENRVSQAKEPYIEPDSGVYVSGWEATWQDSEQESGPPKMESERRLRRSIPASPDARLGYSLAEREQWLAECRLLMADAGGYRRREERDGNGALIGGVLGAVVGGVAGNRIADDNRLAGTLIGAGVGGLAGAAIGSLVDSDGDGEVDANELWAARYCDAYLRRYEMSASTAAYGYGQPTVVVQPVAYPYQQAPYYEVDSAGARRAIPPLRPKVDPAATPCALGED